jgi:intein/homing endonuclease
LSWQDSNGLGLGAILTNGNVGIGTTSPQGKLHVLGNCVTGDTLLPIRRRKKSKIKNQKSKIASGDGDFDYLLCRIDEVLPGDEVLSLNEATETQEWHRIRALREMGYQEVYEVKTKSGRTIKVTAEHPFLTLLN